MKKYWWFLKNIIDFVKRLHINSWGMSVHIDLHGCARTLVRDPEALERFIIELCDLIEMRRRGTVDIDRFGDGDLEGYSAIQKIYDSAISTVTPLGVHLEEVENRVFIDIFSCKAFSPKKAEKFSKDFFKAKGNNMTILIRG